MRVRIKETQPMVKGATQSSSYKPATLENGVVIAQEVCVLLARELDIAGPRDVCGEVASLLNGSAGIVPPMHDKCRHHDVR